MVPMPHQLFLPFATAPRENDPRSRAGQIVRVQAAWRDPDRERGRYWHIRFSTTCRRMETEAIRTKHPDWPARKIDSLALERARPFGDPDVIRHYARAVPHGTFPGEIEWLEDQEIIPTGLAWRVPSWDEIKGWFAHEGGRSEVVDQINAFRQTTPREWHHHLYFPLRGEEDLVRLLAGVDPFWAHFLAHGTFPLLPASSRETRSPAETGEFPFFA